MTHPTGADMTTTKRAAHATQAEVTDEPVAWLHVCRKKPELRELSFSKAWPNLAALGYKARPLVLGDTHPAPSVPDDVVLKAKRYEWLKARNNTAQIGVGRWESDDHFTWLCDLDADEAIDAAMLAAK